MLHRSAEPSCCTPEVQRDPGEAESSVLWDGFPRKGPGKRVLPQLQGLGVPLSLPQGCAPPRGHSRAAGPSFVPNTCHPSKWDTTWARCADPSSFPAPRGVPVLSLPSSSCLALQHRPSPALLVTGQVACATPLPSQDSSSSGSWGDTALACPATVTSRTQSLEKPHPAAPKGFVGEEQPQLPLLAPAPGWARGQQSLFEHLGWEPPGLGHPPVPNTVPWQHMEL